MFITLHIKTGGNEVLVNLDNITEIDIENSSFETTAGKKIDVSETPEEIRQLLKLTGQIDIYMKQFPGAAE